MELSQLRYFIAVAELGNMSKAAETLFVSQPNLSTSISRLEEEVGAPLFERRRGKISLNQNGALLLKNVKRPWRSWTPASRPSGSRAPARKTPCPSPA